MRLAQNTRASGATRVEYTIRQVDEERLAGLSREVSQAVELTVVTTNCEKSAEAIVGKALKWALLKGRTM